METTKQEKKPKRKRRSRRLLLLLLPLLMGGAYIGLLVATSPRDLKEQISAAIRKSFAGKVVISKARLNPFQGIIVRDLHLAGQNGEPFVHIRKLVLHLDRAQLLRRNPVVTQVEAEGPTVTLRYSEDGWNARQLIKPGGKFDVGCAPLTSVSIKDGAISVTDDSRVRQFPYVLLNHIAVMTQPLEGDGDMLGVDGSFADNLVGNWKLSGKFDVPKSAIELSVAREDILLDEKLRKKIPPIPLGPFSELEALDGSANLGFLLSYAPAPQSRLQYDLHLDLTRCRARIARFPYPIDSLTGSFGFKDGQVVLKDIAATSKDISASVGGFMRPERETDMEIKVDRLPIDERLVEVLGENWKKAMAHAGLRGIADVAWRATRGPSNGAPLTHMVKVDLSDCSAASADLPFPVKKINGVVLWNDGDLSIRALRGETPVAPFTVRDTTFNMDLDVRRHLEIDLKSVSIAKLLSALGEWAPDAQKEIALYKPSGTTDIRCGVSWVSGGEDLQYEVLADFSDLSMSYPGVDQPLKEFAGKLKLGKEELTIESATGVCGKNPISIRNLCTNLKSKEIVSGQVKMEGWPIDKDLKSFAPESLRKILDDLDLQGRVDVVQKIDPDPAKTETISTLLECRAKYKDAPYPISKITGRVIYRDGNLIFENVAGENGPARIFLTTESLDLNRKGNLEVALSAKDLPLDAQLKSVLPLSIIPYWDRFNPSGKVNLALQISFDPENSENVQVTTSVDWNGSSLQYVDFAYPVSDVTGTMRVLPDRIVLENMEGKAGTGHLRFHDTAIFRDEAYGMDITIEGRDMSLDSKLRECMRKDVQAAWDIVNPAGKFNFVWHQTKGHGKDAKTDYSLRMELANAEMENIYFKYPLREMTGTIRFQGNKARFDNVEGKNGKATVVISGYATGEPEVGEDLVSLKINAKDVPLNSDVRDALPEAYQGVWDELEPKENPQVRGTASVSGTVRYREYEPGKLMIEYELDPLAFHDCRMELGDVPLDNINGTIKLQGEVFLGRVSEWTNEQDIAPDPSSSVTGSLNLREVTVQRKKYTELEVPRFLARFYGQDFEFHTDWIQAYLYGGRLIGAISIDRAKKRYGDEEVRYSATFKVNEVDVKDLVQLAGVDIQRIKGILEAQSEVTGTGLKPEELNAAGNMSIKNGDMGNLPQKFGIPSALLKSTAFSEAYMKYEIKESKAVIKELNFEGDQVSLQGRGKVRIPKDSKDAAEPAELVFRLQGHHPLRRWFDTVFGGEIRVKLGGKLDEPIWSVDPLVPLRNLVRGLARVLQIEKKKEGEWEK